MKPHMAHIRHTLIRKRLADEAGNKKTSYRKYMDRVDKARSQGFDDLLIIKALEEETERIKKDIHKGDPIFMEGVANAKVACLDSIALIIHELKGEN